MTRLVKEGAFVESRRRKPPMPPRQNFEGYQRRDSAAILADSRMSEQDINNITNRINHGSLTLDEVQAAADRRDEPWHLSEGQQAKAIAYLQKAIKHDTAFREPKRTMFAYGVGPDIMGALNFDEKTRKFGPEDGIVVAVSNWTEVRNFDERYTGHNCVPVYTVFNANTGDEFSYVFTGAKIYQYS